MSKTKHTSRLRLARICCAAVVFSALVILFLDFGGIFDRYLAWLPKLQFWPAVLAVNVGVLVLLVVLTMLFGRVYCSFLCPLGIMQDGIYAVSTAGKKKRKFARKFSSGPLYYVRYAVLVLFIFGVALGHSSLAYLIEPYSIFGRMISSLFGKSLVIGAVSLVTFTIISVLVWKKGRIWCNTVCPVGAILSLLGRKALFVPVIDDSKCISCGLCGKGCRASCIDSENGKIDTSRCVVCFDCMDNCSKNAISFKYRLKRHPELSAAGTKTSTESNLPTETKSAAGNGTAATKASAKNNIPAGAESAAGNDTAVPKAATKNNIQTGAESAAGNGTGMKATEETADTSRRAFIAASVLAAGSIAAKAQEGHGALAPLRDRRRPERSTPAVPAGSVSLAHFTRHCVACQLCVQACPNNVLSPDTSLDRLMRPKMEFDKGFCRPECNACGRVCPAGAIVEVSPEEKTAISIGHAVYNPQLCVVNTDGVDCGNCARHCPSGAIAMVKSPDYADRKIPVVNPERCIGCGRCEYVCPSRPVSAIYVEGNLVHRNI